MRLIVGEPISTAGMTDADLQRLMATTRERVIALKDELEERTFEPQKLRATA